MTVIVENLVRLRERIAAAAARSERTAEDVTLVAVTKTVGIDRIRDAMAAGAAEIGENYVQEAQGKWLELRDAVRWHFIGHLQRNKAKAAVEFFDTIQSVDSLALAQEIGRRAQAANRRIDVLVEVNIAGEATKYGASPEEALGLAGEIAGLEGIRLRGLMGMAPFVENPESVRPCFRLLRSLFEKLPAENRGWLSMGMTQDFEVAIEEGSNMVRIGTAIFGPRM